MVSYELKIAPQQVRQWCLSDLVNIVSDILSKADAERYELQFNDN